MQPLKNQDRGGLHPVQVEDENRVDQREQAEAEKQMLIALTNDLSDELPREARQRLKELLVDYKDVFSLNEGDLGKTTICEHKIDTGSASPVRQPFRRQPLPYREAIDKQFDQMLAAGVIDPALSDWAANVVLAKKKDDSLRFCIDYR